MSGMDRATMFGKLNSSLKRYTPGFQRFLQDSADRIDLPLPKMLWGKPVWTHSHLEPADHGHESSGESCCRMSAIRL
jgi:hypothetical protein